MTAEEKQELRELKQRTIAELGSISFDYARYQELDERLSVYIREVVSRPEGHNLYELLSVKHFYKMTQRYDMLDEVVQRFIVVYESLKFPADTGPTRFALTPIQVFQFTSILWFHYRGSTRRVVTEALLFVPRKFSKTTSVASLAVYDLCFGDANAQAYVAANSYQQAQICFGVIKEVLRQLDPKMRRFKINREQVFNLQRGKTSFAQCLASSPKKLDGLNASVVIVDEYAQAESAALKNVLQSSMASRKNPLTVTITTASTNLESPFMDELNAFKSILRGELENDSIFAHIFAPDVDDPEGDERTWRKVQPHLGITCRQEFYEDAWQKALLTKDKLVEFRTKQLNIFIRDSQVDWLPTQKIAEAQMVVPQQELQGARCVCSVDLSVCDDFSAVSYTLFLPGRILPGRLHESPFHSITEYYFPEGALQAHPNKELYSRWIEAGYLKLCQGDVIDYQRIVNDILSKPFTIMGIGYDPYKSLEFVRQLEYTPGVGKAYLYPISQTYGNFTSPVEMFELSLLTGRLTLDANPITAYCFANAIIDEDRLENRKPIKADPLKKIDGAITNVMNMWMMNNIKLSE